MRSIATDSRRPRSWTSVNGSFPAALEQQLCAAGLAHVDNVLVCDLTKCGRLYQRTRRRSAASPQVCAYWVAPATLVGDAACSDCSTHPAKIGDWAAQVFQDLEPAIASAEKRAMSAIVLSAPCFADPRIAEAFRDEGMRATGYVVEAIPASPRSPLDGGSSHELSVTTTVPVFYRVINVPGGLFDDADTHVRRVVGERRVLVVADENVARLHGAAIVSHLRNHTNLAAFTTMAGSELAKEWNSVARICTLAAECNLERSSMLIAVGGGVVMDVVGVAASLYRRGVDYVRIPTTLVGIVDVAVGIKHGFNFLEKKNALGTFHPPAAALCDRRFLQTLEPRQLRCGLAEIVKMGLIADRRLFELVEASSGPLIATGFAAPSEIAEEIILRAQASMIHELQPNLFERDKRRLVDFGHTVSPVLEACTRYAIHHGEAVAIDMMLSCAIGVIKGCCPERDFERVQMLYAGVGLPQRCDALTIDRVEAAFSEARKHRDGAMNLVVPTGIGSGTFVQHVTASEIRCALSMLK